MLHAVILYSVGSPEALTVPQLRRFLQRFLSDKRVVQLPSFLWQPILQSFILRTRPQRLIKRYEQIFIDGHNPYLATMERLCVNLEAYLNERQALQNEITIAAQNALALSQSSANQLFTSDPSASSLSKKIPNATDADYNITVPNTAPNTTKTSDTNTDKTTVNTIASAPITATTKTTSKKIKTKTKATNTATTNTTSVSFTAATTDLNAILSPNVDTNSATDATAEQQFMVCASYAFAGTTIEEAVKNCLHRGADKITIIPLFPQYSLCTNKTPELKLNAMQRQGIKTPINYVHSYTAEPLYIDSLLTQLTQALNWPNTTSLPHATTTEFATPTAKQSLATFKLKTQIDSWLTQHHAHILFVYHGLPRSYLRNGEPYATECHTTTDKLSSALNLTANKHYSVAFLGHMGPVKWMQPSLEEEVERLLQQHVHHLIVLAPSFAIDCLETLYDINIKLREFFLNKGGDYFTFVPALNDSMTHIRLLGQLLSTAQPLKP